MSLSSFSVVINALRINLFKPRHERTRKKTQSENTNNKEDLNDETNENNGKTEEKEKTEMTKVIKVEGMMCPHCEARVRSALEALECVVSAAPSHKDGTVTLTLKDGADMKLILDTVTAEGYPATE